MLGGGFRGEFPVRGVGERRAVGGEQPILGVIGIRGRPRRTRLAQPVAVAVIRVPRQREAVESDVRQPPRQVIRIAIRVRHAIESLGLGRDPPQVVAEILVNNASNAAPSPLSRRGFDF